MSDSTERAAVVKAESDEYFRLLLAHFTYRDPVYEAKLIAIERGDHIKGDSDDT